MASRTAALTLVPRTLTPATGAVVPDLSVLPGVTVGDPIELDVVTTYLDTAELALLRHGVTLHRVHGSTDDGWVLEASTGGSERRVRAPLSGGRVTPPRPLRELVLALTLDADLVEVAILRTRRVLVELHAEDGGVARVCDDRVVAERLPAAGPDSATTSEAEPTGEPESVSWREWVLEADDDAVLDEIEEPLSAVAEPTADDATDAVAPDGAAGPGVARLRRVLGDLPPQSGPRLRRPKPGKPAARAVQRYLVDQYATAVVADLAVRRREPDSVHDLRVALRRLRSTLDTFRPLLEGAATAPLRAQLREVSHLLGDVREAEVVSARLARLLDEEPADLRLGAARRTIGDDGRATVRLGRRTADDTLRSPEYVAMLRGLRDLVTDPPWRPEAEEPAADVLAGRVQRELRRLRTRIAAVDDAAGAAERARLLHDARRAAKRLRYACEAVEPALGSPVRRLRAATRELQAVLGDHHDTMSTRSVLRRLASRGDLHPGTAFTLGRLHAREEQAARRLEREVDAAWARLDRDKVVGWL